MESKPSAAAPRRPHPHDPGGPPPWVTDILARLEEHRASLELVLEQLRGKRKPLLTVEEAADLVGRTPYTVRRWISQKRLSATRLAEGGPRGRLLIAREQLDRLIRQGLGGEIASDQLAEPS